MSEDVFGLEVIEDPEVHELADNADESELMGTEQRNLKGAERWAGSIRAAHDLTYCQREAGNERGGMAELKAYRQTWQLDWRDPAVTKGTYGEYFWHGEPRGLLPLYPASGDQVALAVNGVAVEIEPYPDYLSTPVQVELMAMLKPEGQCRVVVRTRHNPEYYTPGEGSTTVNNKLIGTDGLLTGGIVMERFQPPQEGFIVPPVQYRLVNYQIHTTTDERTGEVTRLQSADPVPMWDRNLAAEIDHTINKRFATDALRFKLMAPTRWVAALHVGFDDPDEVLDWLSEGRRLIHGEGNAKRMEAEAAVRISQAVNRHDISRERANAL